ncbi:uncharacterized protein ACLA_091350 [Aspergillus clavatus NRRL 1]|uniref:Uncharacterized protein n=1 Tax=Aspergillus clavatus (strain ATCC 1007 / CBS 513.65 / DSM 816 / NCTC 3887 / NRRL 1 / QM 1276 / 107) TaxID=344612 RepID=A1CEY8_ASPCL|nr:uncharacterized protein ACLA_091350 [Aspergillus clavatus NRRL 1]EAW11437.1 hypothetical protein ACLA_091350 [Aspergillus clavatus NRRL 1]
MSGPRTPYPPININVLPSHPAGVDIPATKTTVGSAGSKNMGPLKIPGFRDIAVREYGEWLASNVSDETLNAAFRQASVVTLSDSFDLEHIYKDQNPEFFVGKGIKPGICSKFRRKHPTLGREREEGNSRSEGGVKNVLA